jgi:hypothetical protein
MPPEWPIESYFLLDRNRSLDCRPRIVVLKGKVIELEAENVLHIRVNLHRRKPLQCTRQLFLGLFEVITVEVQVAERVDELERFVVAYLGHHHEEERVGSDIERDSEEKVGTALIELTAELAFTGLAYSADIELEKAVARGKGHLVHVSHVPCANEVTARVRVVFQAVDKVGNLVDVTAFRDRPRPPLVTVDWAQIAIFVSPFIPNSHLVVVEILDIGIAGEKPEELVDDRAQMELFCGKAREAVV